VTITAAASKYSGASPWLLRKASGMRSGAMTTRVLNAQATPVPSAIRVNMLRFHVRTEAQPRVMNGHPAHRTTGVARAN